MDGNRAKPVSLHGCAKGQAMETPGFSAGESPAKGWNPDDLLVLLESGGRVSLVKPASFYWSAKHRPMINAAVQRVLAGGAPEFLGTVGPAPGGGVAEYQASILPVEHGGVTISALVFLADMAKRKRLELQVIEIAERERQRIGRDLHDGICQDITAACLAASALEDELVHASRPEAAAAARISEWLRDVLQQSKLVARGLVPVGIENGGLAGALEELALHAGTLPNIKCSFSKAGPVSVADGAVAAHLYRIAQEALSNAIRHAFAKEILITLLGSSQAITLTVQDDGIGFKPSASGKHGMGVHTMRYRARAILGEFHIQKGQRGTIVTCSIARPRAEPPGE